MAVVVQCFHCKAILELDDGFRGGVCRCSTCGSLLQVPRGDADAPARLQRPSAPPPPAALRANPLANPAATEIGMSSGALDPTRGSIDMGGSSSGLGRIHKTKPISHVSSKSRKPVAPSDTREKTPSRQTTTKVAAPRAGLPQMREMWRNKALFWFSILVLLLLGAAIVAGVIMYVLPWTPPGTHATP